jgi:hypothetical protein
MNFKQKSKGIILKAIHEAGGQKSFDSHRRTTENARLIGYLEELTDEGKIVEVNPGASTDQITYRIAQKEPL